MPIGFYVYSSPKEITRGYIERDVLFNTSSSDEVVSVSG